ncbi:MULTISPECIES: hypothetical protein [Streptomyces]|uniref:hypothetical protein n=1 Tax=Streptomyces TaxID=1883 RepID=UPI001CC263B6|nr:MULTISPECIES: hypothetical protein [Streptomyces]
MSTLMIILLIVAVVVIAAAAFVVLNRRQQGAGGRRGLQRRFGPEYDRAVARHDGDTKAAERDLGERVKRHGSLRVRPLDPAAREQYTARWTVAQERFVDSPREAVAEADRLIAELAGARGFPDAGHYEDQIDALSVHHAHHVQGYRKVHRAALGTTGTMGTDPMGTEATGVERTGGAGTEEMRAALLEARGLFEALVAEHRSDTDATPTTSTTDRHDTRKRSTGITHKGVQHG